MKGTTFGRNLRALRQSKGLTQLELADAVGVSSITVSGWESRGVKPKSVETLNCLYKVLGCGEEDLFGVTSGFYSTSTGLSEEQGNSKIKNSVPNEDGALIYAPSELCSSGNYFMTMPDNAMGKRIPVGCNVLIDIYDEPINGDVVLVSVDSSKPELRAMREFEGVYIFSPETWEQGFSRFVVDTTAPDAPKMQILGVARYLCMEVGNGEG